MKRLRNVPWVSGMLVVINVIVFLMCTFSGNVLYNKGELDVVSVLAGKQYGRLLWAMFLHAGIEHIFNNMVLLFFLGAMIEKVTGHVTFLVLYFLSGIGGNLCSLLVKLLQMDYSASVGASGAIFGLDGVLLAWILLDRQSMKTYCFTAESLQQLQEATVKCLQEKGSATATELKDAMGTSRKYAIPLLEYFDEKRITKRSEDQRCLA